MLLQEVSEGEEEELVLDAVLYEEPVELLEDGVDVFSGPGVSEKKKTMAKPLLH